MKRHGAVAVVGAGIGGLTAALCLHARGIDVELYESVSDIRPLGVGINLLPHAIQVLAGLGLLDELTQLGIETQSLCYFNKLGQLIWQEPRGVAAGLPYPQISIHRGELQMLLLRAVEARLGQGVIHNDCTVTAVANDGEHATLTYQGPVGPRQARAAVIVAADGIHSRVRRQFYPDEGMPIWNGAILWRGLTPTAPFLGGRTMIMAGHQKQKFVAYPVDRTAFEAGASMTNWIAELRFEPTELMQREDWNRSGDFNEFAPKFADWRFPWLDVPALIASADVCYEFPMVDRNPVDRWSYGRVTLLGDAAHPMYPIGSNGASQAILDAQTLAAAMADHADTAAALRAYEAKRLPATAAIVKANRGNGPEQVMQLAEERAPHGFDDIDEFIPLAERQAIAAQYQQIAGFDKQSRESARAGEVSS